MNRKTGIIIALSAIAFIFVCVFAFGFVYSFTSTVIKGNSDLLSETESYSALTKELLESLPEDELEEEIAFHILDYKIGDDYENEYEIVTSLPDGLKYLYATWLLESEVNNGGFNQFFYNSSGQFAQEAYEGYKYFNANEHAAIVAKAVEIYKKEEELHKKVKADGSMEAFSKSYEQTELNKVDDLFYETEENATELKAKYIKENIDEFVIE